MKKTRILVTGSGGYLGTSLIEEARRGDSSVSITAVTSAPQKLEKRFEGYPGLTVVHKDALYDPKFPWNEIDVVVHLAFSRRFCPDSDIADSICYARTIFELVREKKVPGLIYISSQGVYGNTAEMRKTDTLVAPAGIYTMAKYAAEEVLKAVMGKNSYTRYSIIRLDSIAGNQKMLPAFVQQAMTNRRIKVVGGGQIFSFMDVRDAASAILSLAQTPSDRWRELYNVGWNEKRYTIVQLAEIVKDVASDFGVNNVKIELEKREIEQYAGMNSEPFSEDTGWQPRYDMRALIARLFEEYNGRK